MTDDTMTAPAAPGLRRITAAARRATMLADNFAGLPGGVTRWRLAAALRAAAGPLDLSPAMLRLLELYIDLTYDADWTAGSEPVIYRPVFEIAEMIGRGERQVRNIERALMERGLLAWRDSGNHQRRGRRDRRSGRLVYAYGASLAPLAARHEEIIALAAEARAETDRRRRCRLAIGALRRRVLARQHELSASAARTIEARLAAAMAAVKPGAASAALEASRAALAALAEETDRALDPAASGDDTSRAKTTDERRPDRQRTAPAGARIAAMPETGGPGFTDTLNRQSINGYSIATTSPLRAPDDSMSAVNASTEPPSCTQQDMPGLPIALAAASAELRATAAREGPGWTGLVAAAALHAQICGLSRQDWQDACHRLGRRRAALCVIVLEHGLCRPQRAVIAPVRAPGAYFRTLLARGERGTLDLNTSLRGIARYTAPMAA